MDKEIEKAFFDLEYLKKRNEELEKKLRFVTEKNETYKELLNDASINVQTDYKDRLFKFIFGNPENKKWTLSLYNAVNGTDYTNPEMISFNTIGTAIYMRMRNDVSFIISFEMNLWEHQSTFNPNMPMRFLIYAGNLYDKFAATSVYYKYSSRLQPLPKPVCICFYNGKREQPEKQVLKLSEAYGGDGDIEVKVTMLNVNYGKNKLLMDKCKPLMEYAWLVDSVRKKQDEKMDLESAVDSAIDEMPESYEIYSFLVGNRAEVKTMFLTEFDEEKMKRQEREEGIEDILQFLIKTGKICEKDADEARNSVGDKRQNTVIV
jgi:hypothetical protein